MIFSLIFRGFITCHWNSIWAVLCKIQWLTLASKELAMKRCTRWFFNIFLCPKTRFANFWCSEFDVFGAWICGFLMFQTFDVLKLLMFRILCDFAIKTHQNNKSRKTSKVRKHQSRFCPKIWKIWASKIIESSTLLGRWENGYPSNSFHESCVMFAIKVAFKM